MKMRHCTNCDGLGYIQLPCPEFGKKDIPHNTDNCRRPCDLCRGQGAYRMCSVCHTINDLYSDQCVNYCDGMY